MILGGDVHEHEALDPNDYTFKPGWKDIFRMNQNELESEIRKVSRDPTLDPRRKDYLIHNIEPYGQVCFILFLLLIYIFFDFLLLIC